MMLVLGIGNLLMGDEGVGVHAVRKMEGTLPRDVSLLDGGTGGFQLLGELTGHNPVILIDATMDGQPSGTVTVLRPRYASDFPRSLTAHDIGLRDLIEAAALLGNLPEITLITVSIEEVRPMVTTLSPPVAASLGVVRKVARTLLGVGFAAEATHA
jgi:hydrogenase maturation protease